MKLKLYAHQRQAIACAQKLCLRAGIFAEMGTGKTRISLEACDHLKRILVVAPLSAVGVWRNEIKKWGNGARMLNCTKGSVKKRAALLRHMMELHPRNRVFVVVGYESFWREPLRKALLSWEPELVIYDEAHRLARRRTKQSRFAHYLAANERAYTVPHRLGLTGTPAANGLQDYFSIFKALDPTVFGSSWPTFEARYIVKGGYLGYEIVGYRNEDELSAYIKKHAYRITKAEALDLPPQVDIKVPIRLSHKAEEIYKRMRKDAVAEVEGAQGRGTALGRIVLTNILRLQQVTSGFVKTEDSGIIDFDDTKAKALSDLLSDVLVQTKKVVVFCRFRHDVDKAQEVAAGYGRTIILDGRVPKEKRERGIRLFSTHKGPAILIGQVAVSSLAIDLTPASVGIFFSPDYSLTNFLQSRDRLHRIGQRQKVTYYHLVAENTIDEKVYQVLEKKEELMRGILDTVRLTELFSG